MRTYAYAIMLVDNHVTACLDIWRESNTFHIYEHDANVFNGSHSDTIDFIKEWEIKKSDIKKFLETKGHEVKFEQSIR